MGLKIHDDRPEAKTKLNQLLNELNSPAPVAGQSGGVVTPPSGGFPILLVKDNPHMMELHEYASTC